MKNVWLKRAGLIWMFPLMLLLHFLFIALLAAPINAWMDTKKEFLYRWRGGYG